MQLIVNADDFGLTRGVNRGIVECFEAGSVSSTTLMVNAEATEDAVDLARAHPGLGVGLHFNLTLGRPVGDGRGLVGADGRLPSRGEFERRALTARVRRTAVERELMAQLARFQSLGLPLTHVDSHQHVHMLPPVFDVLADYCSAARVPLRIPWVWSGPGRSRRLRRLVRSLLLQTLVARGQRRWGGRLRSNRAFASVFDLVSDPQDIGLGTYAALLEGAEPRSGQPELSPLELMVHPAVVDETLTGLTRITDVSAREYELLRAPDFRTMASQRGWELVTFREVSAATPP